jgi:hypothetical protein
MLRKFALTASAVAMLACATGANAGVVFWDIDPAQSFVRLTVPDTNVTISGIAATVRLRDPGSNTAWTDAGGRRVTLDGNIKTHYVEGSNYFDFRDGEHNIIGVPTVNLRPNPAAFNSTSTNSENPNGQYTNTSTAPAEFGARVRVTVFVIVNVDAGFLAIRDLELDITGAPISMVGSGGSYVLPASTSDFGIDSSKIYFDGLTVTGIGQPIPDVFAQTLGGFGGTNISSSTITNLGGLNRRLDYNINVPVSLVIEGITVSGTAAGKIVAFATVPEFSSMGLLAAGGILSTGAYFARRRRRS